MFYRFAHCIDSQAAMSLVADDSVKILKPPCSPVVPVFPDGVALNRGVV